MSSISTKIELRPRKGSNKEELECQPPCETERSYDPNNEPETYVNKIIVRLKTSER